MKKRLATWRWIGRALRPRFSMRTMLSVMLMAAVFFAWFGWRLRKSQRQARAMAVLQRVGAVATYDYQSFGYGRGFSWTRPEKPVGASGRSPYSRRLQELLGVDFLHNITRVHLETSHRLASDEVEQVWSAIADLPDLVYLEASGPVTQPGIVQRLRHTGRLKLLHLRWAHIADEDLSVLSRMPRLEALSLNETPVSDAAMVHVARARSLRAIALHHTAITDAGLREIGRLPRLSQLRLSGTEIGDAGVRHLGGSQSLRELDLEHTRITDEGIRELARLPNLERLDLSMNSITEAGFVQLEGVPSLTHLRLESIDARPEALAILPRLPLLESLHLGGPIVWGDLSPIGQCQKLRILSCALARGQAVERGLQLPPNLEVVDGVRLSELEMFEQLAALPKLRTVNAAYSGFEPDEVGAVNQFKAARPDVEIIRQ